MKIFNRILVVVLVVAFGLGMVGRTMAATSTVDLGTATPFAILAGTPAITESGAHASTVTGNVGLSPATAANIGLYCSQVTGTIYGVNAAYVGDGGLNACFAGNPPLSNKTIVDNAKLDLTAAYTDAANRTPVTIVPTELGGTTKFAGVYGSDSNTFGITAGAGPLTLDGQGDPNAVFIFEASAGQANALTVGPGSVVQFTGEAQACNVFWRVYGATINTTAVFKGSILALTSITVANGANIEGRLLARNGQVTLINDTITVPVCVAAVATPTPTATASTISDEEAAASAAAEAAAAEAAAAAKLPNSGIAPYKNNIPWAIAIPIGVFAVSVLLYFARRKQTS